MASTQDFSAGDSVTPVSVQPPTGSRSSRVTVMMPAYNAAAYIAAAMDSVLEQTWTDWALLVVDDGSTDATGTLAARYTDPRIFVARRENGGEGAARNTALARATGDYLAFLDADDVWLPTHLEAAVTYLDAHPTDIGVYSDGYHITETGERLKRLSARRRGPMRGRVFEEVVRGSDVFGPPACVVLRLAPILDHGLRFDESLVIGTDWDFFTRVADLGTFGYLDEATCLYRVHRSNVTSRIGLERRARALATCRMNAIRHPAFATCPADVRSTVFHDLLVVQLRGHTASQQDVVSWPEFARLPDDVQAWLLRLMASSAILHGDTHAPVQYWLSRSRQLNPADDRSRLLAVAHRLNPRLCRAVLRWRTRHQWDPRTASPFADLEGSWPTCGDQRA